jgi:predicted pyridoxine 5'-phosphate oxidase superfamily flavin-nucleotide-binding protein
MAEKYMQQVLTPAVQAAQEHYFGRHQAIDRAPERDTFTDEELAHITSRDSFYLATTNSDGWPYVQHRGGPPGFLKVLGPNQLGFADFKGNRQILSTGNLAGDDRVALILMDYVRRERLKLLGRARVLDAREHPELADQLSPTPELRGKVERLFVIDIVSFDWNCPQHITPRYTEAEMAEHVAPLKARIAELENELGQNRR